MKDDEIQQAVARILTSIKTASESYIGAPATRERMETASSKAMGFPVRFPDWDEETGVTKKIVFEPPFSANYIDVRFVIESGEE